MVSCTWTAITSVSSAEIILRLLGPLRLIVLSLQLFSSAETLMFAGYSTSVAIKVKS